MIRMMRIKARIESLRRLKKMIAAVGLCVLIRPSTPRARPLRFARPRVPPIRILIGSLFHSINAEMIDMGRRIMIACL